MFTELRRYKTYQFGPALLLAMHYRNLAKNLKTYKQRQMDRWGHRDILETRMPLFYISQDSLSS